MGWERRREGWENVRGGIAPFSPSARRFRHGCSGTGSVTAGNSTLASNFLMVSLQQRLLDVGLLLQWRNRGTFSSTFDCSASLILKRSRFVVSLRERTRRRSSRLWHSHEIGSTLPRPYFSDGCVLRPAHGWAQITL